MRRSALAIGIIPFCTANALAQSQVQHFPAPPGESADANSVVPSSSDGSHAATTNPSGPLRVVREEEEPPLPLKPAARDRDQIAGHVRIAAGAAFGNFTGRFLDQSGIGKRLGGSPLATVDVGLGLSRQLELVIAADYSNALSGAGCSRCDASSWGLDPMLRFHLVQGMRFSPWLALGGGYRHNSLTGFSSATVKSVDFLRLQLGGDWYATSNIAFGPVLNLGLSTSVSPPKGDGAAVFSLFYAGVRLLFDLPGR